jgi:hypothetical protein
LMNNLLRQTLESDGIGQWFAATLKCEGHMNIAN